MPFIITVVILVVLIVALIFAIDEWRHSHDFFDALLVFFTAVSTLACVIVIGIILTFFAMQLYEWGATL